jgi:hypothetical protein
MLQSSVISFDACAVKTFFTIQLTSSFLAEEIDLFDLKFHLCDVGKDFFLKKMKKKLSKKSEIKIQLRMKDYSALSLTNEVIFRFFNFTIKELFLAP